MSLQLNSSFSPSAIHITPHTPSQMNSLLLGGNCVIKKYDGTYQCVEKTPTRILSDMLINAVSSVYNRAAAWDQRLTKWLIQKVGVSAEAPILSGPGKITFVYKTHAVVSGNFALVRKGEEPITYKTENFPQFPACGTHKRIFESSVTRDIKFTETERSLHLFIKPEPGYKFDPVNIKWVFNIDNASDIGGDFNVDHTFNEDIVHFNVTCDRPEDIGKWIKCSVNTRSLQESLPGNPVTFLHQEDLKWGKKYQKDEIPNSMTFEPSDGSPAKEYYPHMFPVANPYFKTVMSKDGSFIIETPQAPEFPSGK